jgi:hypothetical protein
MLWLFKTLIRRWHVDKVTIKCPKHGNNHIAVQTRGRKPHLHSTAHVHPARSWFFVVSVLCIPDIYKDIRRSMENESSSIIPAHNRCECWIVRANWILKPNWRLKPVQYHLQRNLHNIMQHKSVDIEGTPCKCYLKCKYNHPTRRSGTKEESSIKDKGKGVVVAYAPVGAAPIMDSSLLLP